MSDTDDTPPTESEPKSRESRLPLPSDNPATNLLIADIVVRGASSLLRKQVEQKVAKASSDTPEDAKQALDGRSMLLTLGLYGASKLATRSVSGLAIVASGLVAKTLYDRGKARQKRLGRQKRTENDA
ncbi:hypothetical protein [uncultured Erythrobacter sp.]|uniref:hypothetical protein n=1 Tax=uncultured Erythrobacter sp. TaxID=263913 RepID=UPI00262BE75E|nr:hypothetical protein [uncultured Erythrobacter sp.]